MCPAGDIALQGLPGKEGVGRPRYAREPEPAVSLSSSETSLHLP